MIAKYKKAQADAHAQIEANKKAMEITERRGIASFVAERRGIASFVLIFVDSTLECVCFC